MYRYHSVENGFITIVVCFRYLLQTQTVFLIYNIYGIIKVYFYNDGEKVIERLEKV